MMTEERIAKLTSAVYKVTDLFPEKEPLKFVVRRECLDVLSSYIVLISKSTLNQRKKAIKKAISSSKSLVHYFNLAEKQSWIDVQNFSILKAEYSNFVPLLNEQLLVIELKERNLKKRKDLDLGNNQRNQGQKMEEVSSDSLEKRGNENGFRAQSDTVDDIAQITPKFINPEINFPKIKAKEAKKRAESVPMEVSNIDESAVRTEKRKEKDIVLTKSDVVIDYEELSSIQLKTLEILQNKGFLKASQISQYFEDTSERSIRREIKELKDKSIIVSKGSGKSTFYEINHVY